MPPSETSSRRAPQLVALLLLVLIGAVVVVLVTRDPWERKGPPIAVAGWAPYWQTNEAYHSFDANADLFADVSIVAYHAVGAGEIAPYEQLSIDAPSRFAQRTPPAVALLATIFDDTDAGVMAGVLADPATRTAHARAVAELVFVNDYDGVDLDYEQFAFADSRATWEATAPNWIAFLEELAELLHARDKVLVVSVPSTSYTVFAHEQMGEIVDRIRLMAYDYSTSSPGPIAPSEWVREIVDDLKDVVPAEKIDLGVPVYGYDWPVATSGTCPADQEPGRRAVTPAGAIAAAADRGTVVMWDPEAEEARYDYSETLSGVDAAGTAVTCTVTRTVRFLDDRAIHRRAWIAHRADLHGIAIWALGNDDPTLWTAIRTARSGERDWPFTTNPDVTTTTTTTTEPPSTT